MEEDVDTLVAAVRRGEREAFAGIVRALDPAVRVVVAAIVPLREQVEDTVQEAFVTLYRKLDEYRPGSDVIAWARTIARYTALNERRRWLRHEGLKSAWRARAHAALGPELERATDALPVEVFAALDDCLDRLGGDAAEVVRSRYWDGTEPAEIARKLGRNPASVRSVLHRARELLADCFRAKGLLRG